ncbi:MAG TPA: hypothetical protein VI728_07475 [Syntrophales bacterium]|nr:hypothetical protein [Syntrophales bacterium]
MKASHILGLVCMLAAVTLVNAEGRELKPGKEELECANCLVKVENGIVSLVHFYDNEKMEQIRKLQALGYVQGGEDYAAQLTIPYAFTGAEMLVKVTIPLLDGSARDTQYIVIAASDESGREVAREQIVPEKYNDIIKNKSFLSARLKTSGRKIGAIVLKFAGIKHVKISKIEVE